jgi:hypothetical protein
VDSNRIGDIMKHYKNINNGYITSISTGAGQIEITKQEYNKILEVIRNKPIIAENGYDYKLKEDLTWELYELPIIEYDEEQEAVS